MTSFKLYSELTVAYLRRSVLSIAWGHTRSSPLQMELQQNAKQFHEHNVSIAISRFVEITSYSLFVLLFQFGQT